MGQLKANRDGDCRTLEEIEIRQGTIPTSTTHAIHIADNEIDKETYKDEPTVKRKRDGGGSKMDKGKKSKSGSQKMVEEMSKSNDLSAQTLSSIQSFAWSREDPPGCSIKDVMALVEECGAVEGTNEHFIATEIFIKNDQREMFVNSLHTPVGRFSWLKKKYEVKKAVESYNSLFLEQALPRTLHLNGMGWVQETLATRGECYKMLGMNGNTFIALHDLLVRKYYLVNAGYPNRPYYLAPYNGQRYHVPERKILLLTLEFAHYH
uniref:Uncharacterized protein n=1 Tax=Oryza sativa subsp. japonica TaxID=39947 RepID=Q69PS4_ORYSJ|nr:hypothetical protein [Oryza sativa Japonica Group]BAD33512.1 hypothetical protein [Oryza sativa Japonica Group]